MNYKKAFESTGAFLRNTAVAALLFVGAPGAVAQLTFVYSPQSATNTVGDNVEFAVRATNSSSPSDTLTYQWTNSEGATVGTSQTLVLTSITTASADTYTVTVIDTTASPQLTNSASAVLTVNTTFNSTAGLVAWLPFTDGQSNPNSQTAADASGNNNYGSLQNFENDGNEWISGPGASGGGLFFANTNGMSNNVVQINDAANLNFNNNLAFSLSVWVAGETWTTFDGSLYDSPFASGQLNGANIISKGSGGGGENFELDVYGNDFRFYVHNAADQTSGPTTTTTINNNGVWQHVVCTFDGNAGVTNMAVYVNGILKSNMTAPSSLLSSIGQTVNIGNRQSGSSTPYNSPLVGALSDVRIYNYALSASDVTALYNSYSPSSIQPVVFNLATVNQPIFAGGNLPLYPFLDGTSAMTFGWTFSGTNALSSPTTTACTVNSLAAGNNGSATITVTNGQGTTSKSFTVTGVAPYTYAAQVMALNPLVYWPLDENNTRFGTGTTVAYDYAKGHNAAIGNRANLGVNGPQGPQYNGFPSGHLALGCTQNAIGFGLPTTFGLSTANPTFTAWIYTASPTQASSAGLIFNRNNAGDGGMDYNGYIGYTWNNNNSATYNFNSHLTPSANTWTFAAIAIGSSSTIAYMGGPNGVLYTATNVNAATTSYSWNSQGLIFIGEDSNSHTVGTYNTSRVFNGDIADAAVFNSQLSIAQIQSLYYSSGIPPKIPSMLGSTNLNEGWNFTNAVAGIGGSLPITYTWYSVINGVSNQLATGTLTSYPFTNASFSGNNVGAFAWSTNWALTNAQPAQSGTYSLQLQNAYGTTTSNTIVNIYAAPAIMALTPTNPVIYASNNITFSASVLGATPLTNQWYTNGSPVPGATGSSVTLTQLPVGTYTVTYWVTNAFNPPASASTTLTVEAAPTSSFAQSVLALNPIGYWRLNETNDNLNDNNDGQICHDYIMGNDGVYTNANLGMPGYDSMDSALTNYDSETAAQFGISPMPSANSCAFNISNIDMSIGTNHNAEFTVQAWVQAPYEISTSLNTPGVVGKGLYNNEEFTIDCGNHIGSFDAYRFEVRNAGGTSYNANSPLLAGSDSNWHLLTGVCDEAHGIVSIYIDGTNAGNSAIPTNSGIMASDAAVPMSIGARSSSGASFDQQFGGSINDVAIFTNALTAAQIQAEYFAAGIPPAITNYPTNVTVNQYGTALDSVGVYGTPPLAIQWYYYDTSVGSNVLAVGQTNSLLTLTNVQSTYLYAYATITNNYGSVTTPDVYLFVNTGPAYIAQDITPLNITVPPGTMLTYSVLANGTDPIYFEWLQDSSPVSGATNSTYTFAAPLGTNTFQAGVSNSQNGSYNLGQVATVVANNSPPVLGFNTNGSGWSLQGTNYTPAIANNVLTLTTAAASEATSAYYNQLEYISNGFVASFTYTPSAGTATRADGIAFVLQRSPSGPTVIGTGGGGFGYFGVTPSVAFQMNIFSGASGGVGICWATNGAIGGTGAPANGPTGSVNINSLDPINVQITYSAASNNVQVVLKDNTTLATFTTNYPTGNLATMLGSILAYVGFTGGTGSDDAVQQISNFSFLYTSPQEAPEIVTDLSPLNQQAPVGAPITYSVGVIGTVPLTYEWLENGSVIPGATNSSYSFNAVAGTNTFQCGVSNSLSGGQYVMSSVATVAASTTPPTVVFGDGSLWQLQGNNFSPSISGGVLTLTAAGGNEASSAYYTIPQYVDNGFTASFTYQPTTGSATRADGVAFVVQNSAAGPYALGSGGGGVGAAGTSPSVDLVLDIYSGAPGGTGINWTTNGLTAEDGGAANTGTGSVNINSLDPINVNIMYDPIAGEIRVKLVDATTSATFSTSYQVGDLASTLGGDSAYIGFAGATGGSYAGQSVSNFSFTYAGSAATIAQDIAPLNWAAYAGEMVNYSVIAQGDTPVSYAWWVNSNLVAGATNSTYLLTVTPGTNYVQCGVTNSFSGGVYAYSSVAEIVGITPPADAFGSNLLALGPVAWWRLNESAGSAVAYDYVNGYDGAYGISTTNGQPGIPNPPFYGAPANDLGVWMDGNTASGSTNGFVYTPPLGMTVTNATLLCWIYPNGSQANSEGLVFSRGGTANGINYGANNAMVYTWNNNAATYDWSSGLIIPTDTWSFLALVVTSSNAVAYVFDTNGVHVNTNAVTNAPVLLNGGFAIGADPQSSTLPARIFEGEMDDVAVFDTALSSNQLSQLYGAATTPVFTGPPTISIQRSGSNVIVTWSIGSLYSAPSVNGPWSPVNGASSPYTVPNGPTIFYKTGVVP